MSSKGDMALALSRYCRLRGYPPPAGEHRFARPRLWRFDLAWPPLMLALEFEGGLYGMGPKCPKCGRRRPAGHSSIDRLLRDLEKYNAAARLGWRVLRVTPDMVEKGGAYLLLDAVFGRKP